MCIIINNSFLLVHLDSGIVDDTTQPIVVSPLQASLWVENSINRWKSRKLIVGQTTLPVDGIAVEEPPADNHHSMYCLIVKYIPHILYVCLLCNTFLPVFLNCIRVIGMTIKLKLVVVNFTKHNSEM